MSKNSRFAVLLLLTLLSQCCCVYSDNEKVSRISSDDVDQRQIKHQSNHQNITTSTATTGLRGSNGSSGRRLGPMPPIYINCGKKEDYKDFLGRTWKGDLYSEGGFVYQDISKTIIGVRDPILYQTERASDKEFAYKIPLKGGPGKYQVMLHFAEIYSTAPKQRVFDILLEQSKPIYDVDIVARAGKPNTPLVITRNIYVKDSSLDVSFLPGAVGLPKVNAIEVHALSDTAELTVFPPLRKANTISSTPQKKEGTKLTTNNLRTGTTTQETKPTQSSESRKHSNNKKKKP